MKIKVTRTERHVITKQHPMWKVIDENCFFAKNLYNYANYIIRQEFINNGNWIRYRELDKMLQQTEPYKQLMSQQSQPTLQALDKAWKSFFVAIKDYSKHPEKYLGRPKLPKYKDKNGRYPWLIKNITSYIKDGRLYFRMKRFGGYSFKTNVTDRLYSVRFIPKGSNYVLEIIYEKEIKDREYSAESKRVASIDLGVNNFVTLTNNIGLPPIIINGKGIKAINQYYNKQKAKLQSELKIRHNKHWSRRLETLTHKRNMRIKSFLHKSSRKIVDYCIENNIDALVCGYNKEWKQESKMSKASNQKFIYIPHEAFVGQLEYKCLDDGIKFIKTEESYTSGTSFLDGELPCKENYDKLRRVQRGLFQASMTLINSDVNGSLQITKKVFPNVFDYGIVGCLNPTIINVA